MGNPSTFRVFRAILPARHSFSDGGWSKIEVSTQVFFRVFSLFLSTLRSLGEVGRLKMN